MKLCIILIDNDPISCTLYQAITTKLVLESNVFTFYNGEEALNHFRTKFSSANKYIIFLDINMPVMSGWDFLTEIDTPQYSDSIKVIIVTSLVERAERERAAKHKVVKALFQKPLERVSIDVIKKICSNWQR